jgi:hypothetical protein
MEETMVSVEMISAATKYAELLYEKNGKHHTVWQGLNNCHVLPDGKLPWDSNSFVIYKTILSAKHGGQFQP